MNTDCKSLWMKIHKYEFALIELMLYLDTHLDDRCALAEYEKIQQIYNESVDSYSHMYGPITFNRVYSEDFFTWAATPMPWEMEVYA